MARFNDIIHNFINGEVSPRIYGRTDSDIYRRACETIENFRVVPQGGAHRRTGSELVADKLMSNDNWTAIPENTFCIPFIPNASERFIVCFTGGDNISIYNVNTGVWQYVELTATGPTVDTTIFNDLEKASKIQYEQVNDLLFISHPDLYPLYIQRTNAGTFEFEKLYTPPSTSSPDSFSVPFQAINTTSITLTISSTTATVGATLTASSAYFNEDMVNTTYFALTDSGAVGYCVVIAYTSATSVDVINLSTIPAAFTSGATTWAESSWGGQNGYPRAVMYKNQSLYFGGNAAFPTTIWRSFLGNVLVFDNLATIDPGGSPTSEDPYQGDIEAGGLGQIQWMSAYRSSFFVGCINGEAYITSFTRSSVSVEAQSFEGSSYVRPIKADSRTHFVGLGGRQVREILYDDRIQGFTTNDITFTAEHLTKKTLDEIVGTRKVPVFDNIIYQAGDNTSIWARDRNGFLYSCTKRTQGNVIAWQRHKLGGTFGSNLYPFVNAVISLPSDSGVTDDVYVLVKRTVNGSTKMTLEKMSEDFFADSLDPFGDNTYDRFYSFYLPKYLDACRVYRTEQANFYASLSADADAEQADGTATGTETGTVVYSENFADFAGGSNYIEYVGTSNGNFPQVGTIRWTWYARSNAGSVSSYTMFSLAKADTDPDNYMKMDWDERYTGSEFFADLKLTVLDSASSAIINDVTVYSLPLDVFQNELAGPYNFELNYDLTNGATRLFLNGIQVGDTITSTGTRDTSIGIIRLGADVSGTAGAEGGISDFAIFDSVQHTSNFVFYKYQHKQKSISGLDYLEGETVQVLADGLFLGDFTVTSGAITLDANYDTIIIGLKYVSKLKILPVNFGGAIGSAQGRPTRLDKAVLKLNSSARVKVGRDFTNLDEIFNYEPSADPIVLFTEDVEVDFNGDYDTESSVCVQADTPFPCNVTSIVTRGINYD